MKPITFN